MTFRNVSPRSLAAVLALALAALCTVQRVPLRVPLADGFAYGFIVTDWQLPATHPPFAAILLVPTAWLPDPALEVAFVAGNALLLALLVRLCCRVAGLTAPVPLLLAAVAVGVWLEPDFTLALVCLVLWDLARDEDAIGKGFALGVAAGVALAPAVFIVYLLLTGRVRAGLTALASLTGTVLLGALVLPHASTDFWTSGVFATAGDARQLAWCAPLLALVWLTSRTHAGAREVSAPTEATGPAARLG
ncbi:glycosyltransferase 87 family protein [Streptomyces sp. NPDC004726]